MLNLQQPFLERYKQVMRLHWSSRCSIFYLQAVNWKNCKEKLLYFSGLRATRFLCILLLLGNAQSILAQEYHIYFNPTSKVVVHGSTNVNQFTFKYTEIISIKKPVHVNRVNKILKLSDCILDLKVSAFDSGNGLMNKDFRKMMKEDENPFITVELTSLIPDWKESMWKDGKVEIEVEINSIKKKYSVLCKVENPGSLLIYGNQRILLTDFGLVPPVRMMGMVKVSEVVTLDLALRFATDR